VPGAGEQQHLSYAHRLGWKLLRDPIPEGKELHRRCGVYACWNPDHLEADSLATIPHRIHYVNQSGPCFPPRPGCRASVGVVVSLKLPPCPFSPEAATSNLGPDRSIPPRLPRLVRTNRCRPIWSSWPQSRHPVPAVGHFDRFLSLCGPGGSAPRTPPSPASVAPRGTRLPLGLDPTRVLHGARSAPSRCRARPVGVLVTHQRRPGCQGPPLIRVEPPAAQHGWRVGRMGALAADQAPHDPGRALRRNGGGVGNPSRSGADPPDASPGRTRDRGTAGAISHQRQRGPDGICQDPAIG
jgi:hypothetical protein